MTTAVMAPDERAVRKHLEGALFGAGVDTGRWRLISLEWPYAIVGVTAAPRDGAPAEFAIRFELTGYPNVAPTGEIWDLVTNASLATDRRPKGERVASLFRFDGWHGGATAMYAPWDRKGLEAHPDWAQKYPHSAWHAGRTFTFILAHLSEQFTADDYLGV